MQHLLKLIAAMHLRLNEFADKERGATATEYAILVAFIALLIILGVTFFGNQLNSWFGRIGSHVSSFNS
jgi:pilus assembly protein Flp/PilA